MSSREGCFGVNVLSSEVIQEIITNKFNLENINIFLFIAIYNADMALVVVFYFADDKYPLTPLVNGPLARYVKIRVAHAPGMPGTFSPAANFRGNYYIAIPACITARTWRTCRDACRDRLPAVTGKTFPAFPAHAQPQFCVSGKRLMVTARRYEELSNQMK